jgi:hypothetical protein
LEETFLVTMIPMPSTPHECNTSHHGSKYIASMGKNQSKPDPNRPSPSHYHLDAKKKGSAVTMQ